VRKWMQPPPSLELLRPGDALAALAPMNRGALAPGPDRDDQVDVKLLSELCALFPLLII